MSYNSRHWHDHADDVDRYRKKDELLDEEAESRTLHIEFDVLYQYYEDKVKVTLTSVDFDGELTFEVATGNKARQTIDDLEQWDGDEDDKKPESPKAIPPTSYSFQVPRPAAAPAQQTNRPAQPAPQARQEQPQQVREPEPPKQANSGNPFMDIATDIAEIIRLGTELKPKVDKLRKK